MASTLLERPVEPREAGDAAEATVVVSDPDGTEYSVAIPDGATPAEVAAIAASVSAALSDRRLDRPSDRDPGDDIDPWRWCGRLAATGRRPAESSADSWSLAGRADLF